MGFMDGLMKKMKLSDEDQEYDDYDDYSEFDEEEKKRSSRKAVKKQAFSRDDFEEEEEDSPYSNPRKQDAQKPTAYRDKVVGTTTRPSGALGEVRVLAPKSFDDANAIADFLLKNMAVALNLEGIDMSAAQRIIDFASGSCYTLGGSLQKISKKIFLIVPESMVISGDIDQVIGDMINLNSVNMMN